MTVKIRIVYLLLMLILVSGSLYLAAQIDKVPPVISGVTDKTIIIGEPVLYKDGVSAVDDRDGSLGFTVDVSQVNPVAPGQYTVYYTAADTAGNICSVSAVYTFVEPEPEPEPEPVQRPKIKPLNPYIPGFINPDKFLNKPVTEGPNERSHILKEDKRPIAVVLMEDYPIEAQSDELAALCDEVLSEILTPEMTAYEKAHAIFYWIKGHIWYYDLDEAEDWQGTAIETFSTHRGNCFNYFSVSKALLNRAGFHTIDVQKIKLAWRSSHYWLLVYCEREDYGWGWYHFDTTPRLNGQDYLLWTDKEMLTFSRQHGNCFDFDLSLYPRTPGEEP
jgi:hypothetical protein